MSVRSGIERLCRVRLLFPAAFLVIVVSFGNGIASSFYANCVNLALLNSSPIALAACALRCPGEDYALSRSLQRLANVPISLNIGDHFPADLARLRLALLDGDLVRAGRIISRIDDESCAKRMDCGLLQADYLRLVGDTGAMLGSLRAMPEVADWLCRRGDAFFQQGDLSSARQDYLLSLAIEPDSAVCYRLGELAIQDGEQEVALQYYLQAIHLNRFVNLGANAMVASLALAHTKAGVIFQAQGRLEQAKPHLEAALLADGTPTEAFLRLANIYSSTGDEALAEQILREGIAREPRDGRFDRLYLRLGQLYRHAGREDDAARTWYQGLDRAPRSGWRNWLHFSLAGYHFRREEWHKAIEHYEAGLALTPDHPSYFSIWNKLARAYFATGDHDGAERAAMYALKLNPEDKASHALLAQIREKRR